MMCRKPALAATALMALSLAAAPAAARGLFGGAKKPAATLAPTTPQAKMAAALAAARATPEQRAAIERLDPLARAAFWARETSLNPDDLDAHVRLSTALRALGRFDEAADAAGKVLVVQPNHVEALLEVGRARLAQGQGFYALDPLQRAAAAAPKDWRPHSLMGVAMEQTKRPDDARLAYARALQLSPENPAVLSNMAMMAAASGQRAEAESLLRRAVAQPGATAVERQNLALVLGLSGKVGEAERLIRRDLPPEIADQNLAYLKAATPR